MQPDHAPPSHWNSLSQNWFCPPMNASPFYSVPGLHPDSTINMNRLSEQAIRGPSGDKPTSRMPPHLNPCAIPSSLPSNYLPSVNGYYSVNPGHQDVMAPRPSPYRLIGNGTAGSEDVERDRMKQLFEKPMSGATGDHPPRADDSSGLSFIDDKIIRPQRGRTVFSAKQLHELEKVFVTDQYISGQQRRRLSLQLGLTETQVRVWFQNRRIKWRKRKLERKVTSKPEA